MHVPFESLPDNARVWVYQSDRLLTEAEQKHVAQRMHDFTSQWAAHGQPLSSSFLIDQGMFLILAVDEDQHSASGCSIDSSTHVLKALEADLNIQFFKRDQIAFMGEGGLFVLALPDLQKEYRQGSWTQDTITFNTLIRNCGEWRRGWKVRAGDTWLKRYLPKVAAF